MRESLTFESENPLATVRFGARLARVLAAAAVDSPIVIALNGELGSGKTTFVGGLLRELGVRGSVRSPTYTLIEPYELGNRTFYHLDLYRLQDPRELEPLGLRELLVPGSVLLIEWAERGGKLVPHADIAINLQYKDAERRGITLSARTKLGTQLAIATETSSAHP